MASYLPIRGIHRSQSVRVGGQKVVPDVTVYVDITDGATKRDLQRYSALGSIIVVGGLSSSSGDVLVQGGQVDQGTSNSDLIVRVEAGDLVNRQTGATVEVQQTDLTLSAADATNPRIDLIQVHTGTGVATKKNGTAAASPAAPAPDASNIAVANVTVAANATAVTNANITDRRPR